MFKQPGRGRAEDMGTLIFFYVNKSAHSIFNTFKSFLICIKITSFFFLIYLVTYLQPVSCISIFQNQHLFILGYSWDLPFFSHFSKGMSCEWFNKQMELNYFELSADLALFSSPEKKN